MNTVEVVGCALMAFEKWLEEQIDKKESIAKPIQFLYEQGRSLAFAGVLIALGNVIPNYFSLNLNLCFLYVSYTCSIAILLWKIGEQVSGFMMARLSTIFVVNGNLWMDVKLIYTNLRINGW